MQTAIRLLACSTLATLLAAVPPAAAERPSASEVMEELGFPEDTTARVGTGEMVEVGLKSSNERELGVGLAFLVKEPPAELSRELREGLLLETDTQIVAHGSLTGDGSLDQLAGLDLSALREKYRDADPGALNLSAAEVAALKAAAGRGDAALEAEVRAQLLARYRAYREKGLDGIAPYVRGGGERSAAADLRSAVEIASPVKRRAPTYYDVLLAYPEKPASGFRETYNWQLYTAHGEPTIILTHGFTLEADGTFAGLQRQYYVSGGYNSEQAMVGFLPVEQGTLVIYLNRTSTDQVAGFGGGAKRSVGKKLMAQQLTALYEKVRSSATR